jgi:hypothetical protein
MLSPKKRRLIVSGQVIKEPGTIIVSFIQWAWNREAALTHKSRNDARIKIQDGKIERNTW